MSSRALWAPWRMEYIRTPKPAGCIFCALPGEGPSRHRDNLILAVRGSSFVMMNRYPFNAGHIMVVPQRHASDLQDLPPAEYVQIFDLVRASALALRTACSADGMNIGANLGAAAGAGIAEHIHVHIVPRWRGDLNFMPVIGDVRVMPERLDETYARLLPHFAAIAGRAAPRKARR